MQVNYSTDRYIMEAFVERMIEGKCQLDEKIDKLNDFLFSDKAKVLSAFEHSLLLRQYNAMDEYRYVLGIRIKMHTE